MKSSTKLRRFRCPASGFTLAEIAVVLVIVALLFASAFVPLTTQIEVRNTTDTRKQIDDIKEALIGFALAQGRLPCPADPTIADGAAGAGTEMSNCSAGTPGVVPWATLGLPETDAWGRRFTYRVTPLFADVLPPPGTAGTYGTGCAPTPQPTMSSFALCSPGDINILSANPGTSPSPNPIAYSAAAVIISHGKNGYGASQPNGIRVIDPPASNADETANKTGVPGASTPVVQFVSRNRTSDSTGCSDTAAGGTQCEFDDIVAWIPTTTLIARMAAAGKLP